LSSAEFVWKNWHIPSSIYKSSWRNFLILQLGNLQSSESSWSHFLILQFCNLELCKSDWSFSNLG
jgi:hypothetical protein